MTCVDTLSFCADMLSLFLSAAVHVTITPSTTDKGVQCNLPCGCECLQGGPPSPIMSSSLIIQDANNTVEEDDTDSTLVNVTDFIEDEQPPPDPADTTYRPEEDSAYEDDTITTLPRCVFM